MSVLHTDMLYTYFPAYKTHFPPKMWSKFELRLMRRGYVFISKLIHNPTSISDASSKNNCEDDFSGNDDDFLGFYDE
jgi:hypothetical protein